MSPLKVSIEKSIVLRVQITKNIKVCHELESRIDWLTIWRFIVCANSTNFHYANTLSDTWVDPEKAFTVQYFMFLSVLQKEAFTFFTLFSS